MYFPDIFFQNSEKSVHFWTAFHGRHRAMLPFLLLSFLPCAVAGAPPVAVTGATGKLGRHAVEQLVAAGHPVRCLVRCDPAATASRGQDARNTEAA